jgi:molybdenum cofactor cytidylyltransferase
MSPRVSGLVLAAGGSKRLGQPKQLLPFGGATLLDHVLGVARACAFDQLVCVLGGAAPEVRIPGPIPLDVDTWDDYQAVQSFA